MSTAAPSRRSEPRNAEPAPNLDDVIDNSSSFNMRPEVVQMRLENETMMAECRLRPRDFEKIKKELVAQLDAFPDLATDAIYRKPVGRDPDSGQQKFATGLSIRSAESLAEAYGYNRIRSDVSEIDSDKVKVEATFTDFQRGRIWQDAGILSKTYKGRDGSKQRFNDDRFYNVIVKAEVSKRVREVICRSVNAGLKAWFESECERRADSLLDDKTIDRIVAQYQAKNVTLEMLETLVGRPRQMGWTQADRQTLLGIWNALKDNETSVAEVFGDKGGPKLPTPTKAAPSLPPSATEAESDLVTNTKTALLDAEGIGDCEAIKATWLKKCTSDADRTAVTGLCEARAEEIRASRGANSNK